MKKRILALALSMITILSCAVSAFAATVSTAIIDPSKTASLTIYKYDMTRAKEANVWDEQSYVSTGTYDALVNDTLGNASITPVSSTHPSSYGYAINGVEFTYLKIADIVTASVSSTADNYQVSVQYGFAKDARTQTILNTIGLNYTDAVRSEGSLVYFTSDQLNKALANALSANAINVKNALETAVRTYGGITLPETDAYGKTGATSLPLGLYLLVETRVPDQVVCTCNPFFISLPMTTIDGKDWNYDVTVYPKNKTGMPTLEKTVRESKSSTGKNNGSINLITDGYAHTATASAGDTLEYQVLSTLPTITSEATSLTTYTFTDTLSGGINYKKGDVAIELFKDSACTERIALWTQAQDYFSVSYDDPAHTMTIAMRADGLSYLNSTQDVYLDSALERGCSNCTMRITYTCQLNSNNDTNYGATANDNDVTLTWKRTNTNYYDVLEDDCHVYTYVMDLTKKFSDDAGNFSKVQFRIQNMTDKYYLVAEKKADIYYVTGFTADELSSTVFVPDNKGHIIVKGLEDDIYKLTEIATDSNYTLLKDSIIMALTTAETDTCATCQNKLLGVSASVNGDTVTMIDNTSTVPLTVMNTRGFTLPKTGSYGTWMFPAAGLVLLLSGTAMLLHRHKREKNS